MQWRDFLQINFDKLVLLIMWLLSVILAVVLVVFVKDEKAFAWATGIEGLIIGAFLRDIIGGAGSNGATKEPPPGVGITNITQTTVSRASHSEDQEQANAGQN